ncbi:MAG TPA: Crp/Fnr family transcriptional regulator [Ramlibacter sp.]|uniref:Crp/Fnr family transcriptional regulator n=1 Tax=Ramlibacter sp. TaxID=1917967 RepID=UPI002CBFAA62|nr:Crp/Fnr family transcriptional regulator [Ramlibacter sp.]HVZ42635.1 Crp/Fnr family transcriptional regulator [Ramlibacter sp.]
MKAHAPPASNDLLSKYASWEISQRHSQPWLERADLAQRLVLGPGSLVFEEQTVHPFFYLIRSGYVQATMSRASGNPLLLEIFGPGTLFGEGAAFEGRPRFVTCRTITDCALDRFDPADMEREFARDPRLPVSLIRIMSAKQRVLASKVAGLSSTTPEVRLSDLLLRVARAEQSQRERLSPLSVHLTHEQIGAMTGLARVTVTRTLASLAREDLVRTVPGRVDILRAEALAAKLIA